MKDWLHLNFIARTQWQQSSACTFNAYMCTHCIYIMCMYCTTPDVWHSVWLITAPSILLCSIHLAQIYAATGRHQFSERVSHFASVRTYHVTINRGMCGLCDALVGLVLASYNVYSVHCTHPHTRNTTFINNSTKQYIFWTLSTYK